MVVLDDCWSAPALFRVLRAIPRGIAALVTARQRYAVERIREVGELARPDSLALIRYHSDSPSPASEASGRERGLGGEAGASDSGGEASALCDRLGDHAFAVEIAGKTCKARGLTPADLLAQIKDSPHTLTAPLDYAARDRSNISALIEASLNVLDEAARNVFLAFGAFFAPRLTPEMLMRFVNGVPEVSDAMLAAARQHPDIPATLSDDELREMFQAILAKQPIDTTPLTAPLTQLHDQGLIERVPAVPDVNVEYYSLHDLAYAYAAGQINPDARHRALDACLAYLTRYDSPSLPNFAALRPELDGLLEGAKWAFEHDRYEDATDFADSLYSSGNRILNMQGFFTQVLNLYGWTVQAARVRGNRQHEGAASGNLGLAYVSLGRYDEAITQFQQILPIFQEMGNRKGEAITLGSLGNAYNTLGRYDEAISHYQQILVIQRQIGDRRGEASALGNLGIAYDRLGRYDEAIIQFEQVLPIFREIGDRRGEANALGNLGNAYFRLGRTDEAITQHQGQLTIARQIGDRQGETNALGNLGLAYASLGCYDEAITQHQQSLAIKRQIGDRLGEGNSLNNLGAAFAAQARYAEAIQHFEAARVIFAQLGVPQVAGTERNLARVKALLAGGS
jgi:tetratricopeptide (TPR) repeat protein